MWDAEAVLGAVAGWVAGQLAACRDGPVVLVVDETGDTKSSTDAVGAASQYSGSLGGVEVCEVGVHLSLATAVGHAVIDRRLYLGRDWAEDEERRSCRDKPRPGKGDGDCGAQPTSAAPPPPTQDEPAAATLPLHHGPFRGDRAGPTWGTATVRAVPGLGAPATLPVGEPGPGLTPP